MELVKVNNKEQLNICLQIRSEVFVKEQNVPIELEVDEYDEGNSNCIHYLIKDNDTYVGTFRTIEEHPKELHLQRFAILKSYRQKGYGRSALLELEKRIAKDYELITLNAQITAISFYEKCGYKCVSDYFYDANILHKTMKKWLNKDIF